MSPILLAFRSRKIKKLQNFLNHVNNPDLFSDSYREYHADRISCIGWLIGYYEGRTGGTPKEWMEDMLHNQHKDDSSSILFLYNWIYYGKITGF